MSHYDVDEILKIQRLALKECLVAIKLYSLHSLAKYSYRNQRNSRRNTKQHTMSILRCRRVSVCGLICIQPEARVQVSIKPVDQQRLLYWRLGENQKKISLVAIFKCFFHLEDKYHGTSISSSSCYHFPRISWPPFLYIILFEKRFISDIILPRDFYESSVLIFFIPFRINNNFIDM